MNTKLTITLDTPDMLALTAAMVTLLAHRCPTFQGPGSEIELAPATMVAIDRFADQVAMASVLTPGTAAAYAAIVTAGGADDQERIKTSPHPYIAWRDGSCWYCYRERSDALHTDGDHYAYPDLLERIGIGPHVYEQSMTTLRLGDDAPCRRCGKHRNSAQHYVPETGSPIADTIERVAEINRQRAARDAR